MDEKVQKQISVALPLWAISDLKNLSRIYGQSFSGIARMFIVKGLLNEKLLRTHLGGNPVGGTQERPE